MAKLLKLRRGTTSQHSSFTGAEGEVTVDTDKEALVVHNGAQAGGFPVARADGTGVTNFTITGELDAATLDISGNADIDGTCEADAYTVNGTALDTHIAGVTVTNATNAVHVSVADNENTNENNLIPFIEDASSTGNVGLESDGDFHYNPSTGLVSVPAVTTTGNIIVGGNLTVSGTTTTIDSTTLTVDDKNIELGSVSSPSDTTADGGGITLKGASDKTILWTNSTDSWDFNQDIKTSGKVTDSKGDLRSIPQNTQGSTYTLVATDAGKHILASGTVTVPDSVFSAGDAVTIVNNTGSDLTITKTITTMYLGTDATSANRTLATRGIATILFASGTVAYISGAGLT